jgi:hypothetical protein
VSATRGSLRLGRSAALGTSCLLLSLAAHVLAGGPAPSLVAVVVLAVPVTCAAVWATGQRAGLARVGTTLGLTQVGLHQAFMTVGQPGCYGAMPLPGPAAAVHDAAMSTGCPTSGAAATAPMPTLLHTPMHILGSSSLMAVGHLLAAVGTALLLWYGERLLWSLLGWLAWVPRVASGLRIQPAAQLQAAHAVRRVAGSVAVPGGVGRRGPPVTALR